LQLIASKNLLLPRLDVLGTYRFLGVGQDLIDYPGQAYNPAAGGSIAGTDAFSTLDHGKFQEWETGLRFSMPIGFRQELAAVRNAQLQLARERSVLQDMELEVSHQLADAVRDVDTNYVLAQTNFNRRVAAEREVEAVTAAYEAGTVTFDLLLEAQRNRSDAEAGYYRALTDYNKAITQVHFRKGSLLEYNGVCLAEGPWPAKAYFDARRRARARDAGEYLNYGWSRPAVFSEGPYQQFQNSDGTAGHAEGEPTEAMPEEVNRPTPAPAAPKPQRNDNRELPAPMTERSIESEMGPRLSAAATRHADVPTTTVMQSSNAAAPPAIKSVARPSTLKLSGVKDEQVRQASFDDNGRFDWGDLPLGSTGAKKSGATAPAAAANSSSTTQSTSGSSTQWKGTADSEAGQTSSGGQSNVEWKRAIH
jgi:hypothetical protein